MITYIACLIHIDPTIPLDQIIDLDIDPHTRTYLDHIEAFSRTEAIDHFLRECEAWSEERRTAWHNQNCPIMCPPQDS